MQYALQTHRKCLEREQKRSQKNALHEDKIWRLSRELEEIVSHPEMTSCEEKTEDPLALLRNFFRNFRALQVDDFIKEHNYGNISTTAERTLVYEHCFNGDWRQLRFRITAWPEKEKVSYDFNPYTDDFSSFAPPNAKTIELCPFLFTHKKAFPHEFRELVAMSGVHNEHFTFALRGSNVKLPHHSNSLDEKLPPNVPLRFDYLLQKFFRGEYDKDNPILYSSGKTVKKETEIDENIQRTLDALFNGEEKDKLKERITAQLKTGRQWESIPRLNLGAVRLPNPGQRDINSDYLIAEGAPLLVEYLDSLGVMSSYDAEALVSKKLTHYFLHKTGFQRSRENAERVLESLRGESGERTREVKLA